MKTIKINPKETGWTRIDGNTKTIVAHFDDGRKETMSLIDYITAVCQSQHVVQIDCYTEGEEVMED
jgi:hypothetical protein